MKVQCNDYCTHFEASELGITIVLLLHVTSEIYNHQEDGLSGS